MVIVVLVVIKEEEEEEVEVPRSVSRCWQRGVSKRLMEEGNRWADRTGVSTLSQDRQEAHEATDYRMQLGKVLANTVFV